MVYLLDSVRDSWHEFNTNGTCWNKSIYVYDIPQVWINSTLIQFVNLMKKTGKPYDRCLTTNRCKISFGSIENAWTYTGELLILSRFLSQCRQVTNPDQADAFIVPFPFSMWQVVGWHTRREFPNILRDMNRFLIHMNEETAPKHIFFDTNDSIFIVIKTLNRLALNSIVIHLGDDKWISNGHTRTDHFPRSIVVPYRTSTIKSIDLYSERRILLFGALNTKRHRVRKVLVEQFRNVTDVMVREMSDFQSLQETGMFMSHSKYCICPYGDIPGFTQRFYSSLLKGCVPVKVDPYSRFPFAPYRYPFEWLIDWNTFGITFSANDIHKILPTIRSLEAQSFSENFRKHMIPRLNSMVYDTSKDFDASQAALQEIVSKL